VKRGFAPISLKRYVKLHMRANPGTDRDDLVRRLRAAMDADARGVLCRCGNRIWIIGSAEVGLACFTCITGEPIPHDDYEILPDRRMHLRQGHNRSSSDLS
jgi:hypothetical protein